LPSRSMNLFDAFLRACGGWPMRQACPSIHGPERRSGSVNLSVSHAGVECSLLIDPRRT
jgi:hypothetical protein